MQWHGYRILTIPGVPGVGSAAGAHATHQPRSSRSNMCGWGHLVLTAAGLLGLEGVAGYKILTSSGPSL
eukprot:6426608-Pyramimonas_sp.AAC.1